MASNNASRQRGGAANKNGTSRDTTRGSQSAKGARASTSAIGPTKPPPTNRGSQSAKGARASTAAIGPTKPPSTNRPKSSAPEQSSGSVKGEKPVSRGVMVHHTTKIAWEDAHREWETKKAEWEKEKADLEKEKADLQRRLEKGNNKAKTTESECDKLREKMEELEQSLSQEKEGKKTLQKKYNQLEQDMEREFNESKTEWENDYKKLIKKHTKEKEQLLKAITSLTVEKDNLLTRLSTIASDRLTHENVNIADLSNADRPTKLQEGYSELYDNEWTDAFEELTAHEDITENCAIIILLKILMSSFQNCREITWGRYERLKNVASYIEQEISLPSPKVMSNVSEPGLTTQKAESSGAQLDKNDERVDQIAANGKVEMEDPSTIKASEEEIENEIGKTSNTDKNVDNMQEQAASRETGENKGMQIVSEKSFFVKDTKDIGESSDPNESEASSKEKFENKTGKKRAKENVQCGDPNVSEASKDKSENKNGKKDAKDNVESSDPNESEASTKDNFENKKGKKRAKENVQSGDPNKDTKDIGESSDPNESEASSKEKFENKTGKKRAKENVQSGDPNVSEASKDKSENKNGKKGATENVESSDENVSEVSKDKSENKKGKKDAKDNVESSDPNESEASSKDNFENKKGKKRAKENVQSGDPNNGAKENVATGDQNMSEASKDKSENTKGKKGAVENVESGDPYKSGKENVESGDPKVIGASKDKSENNGVKENMESGDQNMSKTSKDKFEKKTGKHLKCTIDLNFELTHDIKGIWRKTTLELKGIAAEPLCSLIETCLDMPFAMLPMTSKYLKRCIDLCWKMGVQEKPLHLDGFAELDAYAGKNFDKDKFRSYTRSGSHIDFVVWPTLYLYEGGPILVKGIVQCCSPVEAKLKSLHN